MRLTLDDAKHIGLNYDIDDICYIGSAREFNEFSEFAIRKFPNVTKLTVKNLGITTIIPRLMMKLSHLNCTDNPIKTLKYGPELEILIADNTDLELVEVLAKNEKLKYLKIGAIENRTRITIDSEAEYRLFRAEYI